MRNDSSAEYGLGRQTTPAGQNDSNTPNKVFRCVPAEDARTKVILEARRRVLRDSELDYGARCLFVLLLDMSLSWWTQRADGVVVVSVTKLSEELGCAPRTVYDWKRQLESHGHVWVTEQRMPNMWPVNTYHISALDSPKEPMQLPTKDGLWGNGHRRDRLAIPGQGARGGDPCIKQHASQDDPSVKTPILRPNAGASGSPPQVSAANSAAGSRKECMGGPQTLRRGAAEDARGSRKKGQVAAAKNSMRPPQNPADNKESIDPDNRPGETSLSCSTAEDGASGVPTSQPFSGSPAIKWKRGEKEFLEELTSTLAKFDRTQALKEMANWGGRWRNRYRDNPDKARRVLNELASMIKMGLVTRNAGAAADDLWRRFAE